MYDERLWFGAMSVCDKVTAPFSLLLKHEWCRAEVRVWNEDKKAWASGVKEEASNRTTSKPPKYPPASRSSMSVNRLNMLVKTLQLQCTCVVVVLNAIHKHY